MRFFGQNPREFIYGLVLVILCSAIAAIMSEYVHQPATLLIVYMIGIVYAATRFSETATYCTCLLSLIAYDTLFLSARGQLTLLDRDSLFTIAGVVVVTVVIARMSSATRREFTEAVEKEAETQLIYNMSCDLANTHDAERLASIACNHITRSFDRPTLLFVLADDGVLKPCKHTKASADQLAAAKMCLEQKQMCKIGSSETHSQGIYLPLKGSLSIVGVLAVTGSELDSITSHSTRLLETLANQAALAIERSVHWDTAEKRKVLMETIKMRNALLSSVSHDIRTPLAAIMGAASVLKDDSGAVTVEVSRELGASIFGEADRLNRFLLNLLDMTRLESGSVRLHKEWNSIEECFGAAISRTREQLAPFKIVTKIPADLPLILMDALLIEQVLVNLLDNAAKYAISGTEIVMTAEIEDAVVKVSVLNHGMGIEEGEEEKIFDKFYRSGSNDTISGIGLGLTICRSIIHFHGGKIWAERVQANVTRFVFTLPASEMPPTVVAEEVHNSG
ncbi:MAG: DUF4118 domain-containing protein [Candidatus Melainabacteria bacterium]|nr:MAG: DUF4118 domain-containing protein [Candidatus Melainabacteria bacterium]